MSKDGQWKFNWYDSDIWSSCDDYNTKEEAIEAALSEEFRWNEKNSFKLGQLRSCKNDIRVYADSILEQIGENIYDEVGEVADDYLRHVDKEHEVILDYRLNKVIKEWMVEFGYLPDFYKIVNIEQIKVTE